MDAGSSSTRSRSRKSASQDQPARPLLLPLELADRYRVLPGTMDGTPRSAGTGRRGLFFCPRMLA